MYNSTFKLIKLSHDVNIFSNISILINFGSNNKKFSFFNSKGYAVYTFKGSLKYVSIEPPLNIIIKTENIKSIKNIIFII